MELKEAIRPTVIVEYTVDRDMDQRRTAYARGFIDGYGGSDVLVIMPVGRHEFSRKDGRWIAGDCLNYKDGAIMDFDRIEASIAAGYGGDVDMHGIK